MRTTFGTLATVLAFSALACGPAPQAAPQIGSAEEGVPRPGGYVAVKIQNDPFDWDPSYVGKSIPNNYGIRYAYNTLIGWKHGPDVEYNANIHQPELAERWEVSPDAKTFTFHLRRGVKFADLPPVNGREFTSADVKFNFEYWSRTGEFGGKKLPTGQYEWMFEGLQSVETPDPYTVIARFRQPFITFLGYAGSGKGNSMMPREIYDADGNFQTRIAGTGPFQLDAAASQKGTRYVWKKNPTYWQQGKPHLDEIRWIIVPDDASSYAAFKAKQIDIIGFNIEAEAGDQLAAQNPDAIVFPFLEQGAAQLYINTREAPFNDLRVRKALSLGIDREEFVKVRTSGKGRIGMAGAPSGGNFFTLEETRKLVPYDPDQASRLLKDAGYNDGLTLRMTYPGTAYGDGYITSLQLLQAQLKKVGFNVDLVSEDKSIFSDNRKKAKYTINLIEGASLDGDVDSWLYSTWYPGSKANYNGANDPKVKELLDAEVAAVDPAKRRELIREALRYINADQYLGVSIYHGVDHHLWQPWVKNYRPNFWIDGYPVTNVWVQR